MRKCVLCIKVLLLFLFLFGCKEDSPTEPVETDKLIGEAEIGSEGGMIETEDFILTVPQFAFSEQNHIKLFVVPEQRPTGDNVVSNLFIIDGLPFTFNSSLEIKIKADGSIAGESFLALGEDLFVRAEGIKRFSYSLLPASVSDGFLVGEIPVPDPDNAMSNFNDITKITNSNQIRVYGSSKGTRFVQTNYNFIINVQSSNVSAAATQNLLESLQDAFIYFSSVYNFSYSARTNWPVTVNVLPLDDNVYGYYADSYWGINHGYLEFNSNKIENLYETRLTAGHEFFHLVQSLYDPRSSVSKAGGFNYTHYWLDEATSVWVEKLFANSLSYVSDIVEPYQLQPFEGIQNGVAIGAREHGYGMSILFEYLFNNDVFGSRILLDIYKNIKSGAHPVQAILNNTDTPFKWYPGFCRSYFLLVFPVFNVGPAFWSTRVYDTFTINSEADSVKTFSFNYPDLSARYYKIDINDTDIGNDVSLNFNLTGNGIGDITLIKARGSQFQFLETNPSSISLTNLKDNYVSTNTDIYAIITNSLAVSPYTGSREMSLEVKLEKKQSIKRAYGYLGQVFGTLLFTNPDGAVQEYQDRQFYRVGHDGLAMEVTFNGTSYTGTWNYDDDIYTYSGNILFTMNDTQNIITHFQIFSREYNNITSGFVESGFTAQDLFVSSTFQTGLVVEIDGEDIADYTSNVTWYSEYYNIDHEKVTEQLKSGTEYYMNYSDLRIVLAFY